MSTFTKISLRPLPSEHDLPLMVDFGIMLVVGVPLTATGLGADLITLIALVVAVAAHLVQVTWLLWLGFDDTGITIVRPWRRHRVEWSDIVGLAQTVRLPSSGGSLYVVRLVLTDPESPPGRFPPWEERQHSRTGPVLMKVGKEFKPDTRAGRCEDQIYTELEKRGLRRPTQRGFEYWSKKYSPEELFLAEWIEKVGKSPVTVNHGPATADTTHLITETLPELARTHGADDKPVSGPTYTLYTFHGPDAQQSAEAFLKAAQAVAPATWTITPTALPSVP
jgi:hypothetical protein